ncbi:MAG TPA: hypothetical protein VL172_14385 [Kofleriaceae bacterium]|nr:hypothetical protein [Kofleriaceae bacterium]
MSTDHGDPRQKHRHDVGAPDHGPRATERTTRSIQALLGLAILATGVLLIYAALVAGFEIAAP